MRETVPAVLAGERVDRIVAMLTSLPRAEVARMVKEGRVTLAGKVVRTRSQRVEDGQLLEIDVADTPETSSLEGDASVEVAVVHADDDVIVVDKPPGLVVHPGAGNPAGTLVHGLLARFPDLRGVGDPARPGIVHRLDKGTSGLLVVARSPVAYAALVQMMSERAVDRRYEAMVWGSPAADAGTVDAPIGRASRDRTRMAVSSSGREARTGYEVRRRWVRPEVSLLECRLETGRTHQIRVHLAAIGHPIVGDARYGGSRPAVAATRPFLHAARLSFAHPLSGVELTFASPRPPDLESLLQSLDSQSK